MNKGDMVKVDVGDPGGEPWILHGIIEHIDGSAITVKVLWVRQQVVVSRNRILPL